MRLQKLVSSGFKGQQYDLELEHVNLIHGENRSGKTAIIAAMQACCHGEVDKVGGANAKLALLADESKKATATLTVEGGYELAFAVSQGKSASVSRTIKLDGMPLDVKLAEECLFGGVPQYPRKLFSLTGEELWSLMMPQGDGKTPDPIANAFNAMRLAREKAGLKSDAIRVPLESTDIGIASSDGLKAAKEALSEIKKMITGAELQLATDIPIYDGPSKPEVEEAISVLKKQLDEHQTAVRGSKLVTEEIEKTNARIAKYTPEYFDVLKQEVTWRQVMIEENESLIRMAEEIIEGGDDAVDVAAVASGLDSLNGAFGDFYNMFHDSLFDLSEAKESLAKMFEDVESWIKKQVELNKESVYLKKCEHFCKVAELPFTTRLDAVVSKLKAHNKTLAHELESKVTVTENSQQIIDAANNKLDELMARSFSLLSQEQVNDIVSRLEGFRSYASQMQQVELLEKRREQVAAQLEVYKQAEKATDELITKINDWRREVIDGSIKTICDTANARLADVGFEGINITLSQGKRSAAVISTANGIHLQTLSGAEETIYGTALLYAIQKFRQVKCPVIYVEGGELSEHYLGLFLQSYVNQGVNLVVAHYLSPVVDGVNCVSVGELVA